jgi:hypothetical protein
MPHVLLHVHVAQGPKGPPDPQRPCHFKEDLGYLTVINLCPKDQFKVALLRIDQSGKGPIYAMGADATSATAGAKHQWLGPFLRFPKTPDMPEHPIHVAVLREADGKMVAPKGIKQDGTLVDVSSSKKRACQLFVKGSSDFAIFRARLSADGTKVLGNDFYRGDRSPPVEGGAPCEQYFETGPPAVEGRMVDVYDTGSCRVVIDDCRK